jgi:hypothetical protein
MAGDPLKSAFTSGSLLRRHGLFLSVPDRTHLFLEKADLIK